MPRRCERVLLCALALAGGCSPSAGGAVGLRWKLIVEATGQAAGGCKLLDPTEQIDVVIDQIQLVITDAAGTEVPCATCRPACGPLETTTAFEIPEGGYHFAIRALACGGEIGHPPPPVSRTVLRGQITNLNVIQIAVPACTRSLGACDGGVMASCGPGR